MSKVIDGARVLTYQEWEKLPSVQELLDLIDECPECDGEGTHECLCGHEHECQACNGTGATEDLRGTYEKQLRDELEALFRWRDGLPIPGQRRPDA